MIFENTHITGFEVYNWSQKYLNALFAIIIYFQDDLNAIVNKLSTNFHSFSSVKRRHSTFNSKASKNRGLFLSHESSSSIRSPVRKHLVKASFLFPLFKGWCATRELVTKERTSSRGSYALRLKCSRNSRYRLCTNVCARVRDIFAVFRKIESAIKN